MQFRDEICGCSLCGNMLFEGDTLADLRRYDIDGDLDDILLAHKACAEIKDPNRKNWKWNS